jgi:hypothetical protein
MTNHLIVIPGFGMCADDIPSLGSEFTVEKITPEWSKGVLTEIAKDIADRATAYDRRLRQNAPGANLLIYGFSVGADILMEMANPSTGGLVVRSRTVFLLADPNINSDTCFVTKLAAQSDSFDQFKEVVSCMVQPSAIEKRDMEKYLESLRKNGAHQNWAAHKQVAAAIVQSVDKRFSKFFTSVDKQSGKHQIGRQQVVVVLSQGNSHQQFHKAHCGASPTWVWNRPQFQHFRFIDSDGIEQLAQTALQLAR